MTPDPNLALFEALQTLIAPGHRVRLSPYVEGAQFQVLFGERPNPVTRHEDGKRILRQNQAKIDTLAGQWKQYAREHKPFHTSVYTPSFLETYLAYYFTTNVCKIQLILLELAQRGLLHGSLSVIDVGVGSGTTAVATLDFLAAWATVASLYQQPFPVTSLDLLGLDSNPAALDCARQVTLAFADALEERAGLRAEIPALTLLAQAARGSQWQSRDLEAGTQPLASTPTLLIASNVLNELSFQGEKNLALMLASLPAGSLAVVIEPGKGDLTRNLNRWRRDLVRQYPGIMPILPCGGDLGRQQSGVCGSCYNARRQHLHPTLLYQSFRQAAAVSQPEWWDTFENNLLSWSYTVLQRSDETQNVPSPGTELVHGQVRGPIRYIGRMAKYPKDSLIAEQDETQALQPKYQELLKFCPARLSDPSITEIVLPRQPGTLLRKLHHGELINSGTNLEYATQGNVAELRFRDIAKVRWHIARHDLASSFLTTYGIEAQAAIDETAFRLFGFVSMRPFQHEILRRVLMGQSVLAIAATGGGKSECFILPAMILPGVTIVVSPLKSLMQDQYDQRLRQRYGLDHLATFLNSDVSFREREARLKRLELGYYKLVYFTPEQLDFGHILDCLQRTHQNVGIRFLALDEAHCISHWGHDFRPSYLNLWRRLTNRGITAVRIGLTATASPPVRRDLREELELADSDIYVHTSNRPELNFVVHLANSGEERSDRIVKAVREVLEANKSRALPGAAIVFMPLTGGDPEWTKHASDSPDYGRVTAGVNGFASYLEKRLGQKVAIYHGRLENCVEVENNIGVDRFPTYEEEICSRALGDLSGRLRRYEQNAFIHGERECMVATKGFGMGIDKPNIRLIVHRCAPLNLEAYAQEAGRAGRDGQLADVVLIHSPAAAVDVGVFDAEEIPADYEIQQYFLETKYVRRMDVLALRAFLLACRQAEPTREHIFFTNDEAIGFLERCRKHPGLAGLEKPYQWPPFPPRKRREGDWGDHLMLLERGYLYDQRTSYIGRILASLHRIRPLLPDGKKHALLESLSEVRPILDCPEVINADAIVASNYYFGPLLRNNGIDPDELTRLLIRAGSSEGVQPLADRLKLSLAATVQVVSDIRESEVFLRYGKWVSSLLRFRRLRVPRRGPAEKLQTVAAWRDYAGAVRRASKSAAQARAHQDKRFRPNVDDWFGDRELPQPKGWELKLGSILVADEAFREAVHHFEQEQNARQNNDWASYRMFLTDYIGVSAKGEFQPRKSRNCLRAVMLGYLETFEVVVGDDCRSCSRCRPNGDFETDLGWRRNQMVVQLGPGIGERVHRLKTMEQAVPSPEETTAFWEEVAREETLGRSLKAYVLGWTGKLLNDNPRHQTALWLRLSGMTADLIPWQTHAFLDQAEQLTATCAPLANQQLLLLLTEALPRMEEHPRILVMLARLNQRLGQPAQAARLWQKTLAQTPAFSDRKDLGMNAAYEAHVALAELFSPDSPLADATLHGQHTLNAARHAPDVDTAVRHYRGLVAGWSAFSLQEELEWLAVHALRNNAPHLVLAWMEVDTSARRPEAVALITASRRWETWPELLTLRLLNAIPPALLANSLSLRCWQIEAWLRGVEPPGERDLTTAALIVLGQGWNPAPVLLRQLAQYLFETLPETEALSAIIASDIDRAGLHSALEGVFRPQTPTALVRWLSWFSLSSLAGTRDQALATLQLGLKLLTGQTTDLRRRLVLALRPLRDVAAAVGCSMEEVHRLWDAVCQAHAEERPAYLVHLAKANVPGAWVDELIDLLLEDPQTDFVSLALAMGNPPWDVPLRLQQILRLIAFLKHLETSTTIASYRFVKADHIAAIRRTFSLERAVENVDMAIALLSYLRRTINPDWLTPMKEHIQLLVLAGRFDEAYELSDKALAGVAKGKLILSGVSVEVYLAQRCTGQSRQPPPEEADYQRVIKAITRSWACYRRDRDA